MSLKSYKINEKPDWKEWCKWCQNDPMSRRHEDVVNVVDGECFDCREQKERIINSGPPLRDIKDLSFV